MKAGVVGLLILVLIIGGGAFFYLNQSSKPTEQTTPTQSEDKLIIENSKTIDSNIAIGSDSSNPTEPNPYQEYSKSTFDANAGKKTRILFFYADWCPTCRPVDADIKANLDKIPSDIEIIRVNYNDTQTDADEEKIAAKYGITYQHTFVRVDSGGNEIDKWNGGNFKKLLEYVKSISPDNRYYYPITDGPVQ